MLGLLLLSLAFAGSAAALDQSSPATLAEPGHSLPPGFEITFEEAPTQSFDKMELHPSSDICYKIRAFVFSQDAYPKFLRETTCGPKIPQSRRTQGYRPTLVPLQKSETATVPTKR